MSVCVCVWVGVYVCVWVCVYSVLLFILQCVHTRRVPSCTFINSHQELVSGQACNPPDPR